jgi:hemerythrin-like domain-containing protein
MQATDILTSEHRVIEQVLNCLDKMVAQAVATDAVNWADAGDAVDFFRTFADRCHHRKEERHLFRLLEERGFSREQGPTGVMLDEHELGRHYVRGMAAAVADGRAGRAGAVAAFIDNARAFLPLLRLHIMKEEHRLFPMANRTLSAADQDTLLDAFEHVESDELESGTHERYLEIANRMADRYSVRRAESNGCPSCCHHAAHHAP